MRFPRMSRRDAGYQLYRVQAGFDPSDWKPLAQVGGGVRELRIHMDGEYWATPPRLGGTMAIKITKGSHNVFRDLGYSAVEAEHLRVRAELMVALERLIARRRLTQARAAKLLGVSQPRVSDLVRGRFHRFSIDALVAMLARAGVKVHFTTERGARVA